MNLLLLSLLSSYCTFLFTSHFPLFVQRLTSVGRVSTTNTPSCVPTKLNDLQLSTSQSGSDLRPHVLDGSVSLDRLHQSLLTVVVDDRSGLVVILVQTLLEDLGVVVLSLDQRLASDIVLTLLLRGVEHDVVGAAASGVHSSTGDALDQLLVGHVEGKNGVNLHSVGSKHLVELIIINDWWKKGVENIPSRPEE